jgi:hypothetical protein
MRIRDLETARLTTSACVRKCLEPLLNSESAGALPPRGVVAQGAFLAQSEGQKASNVMRVEIKYHRCRWAGCGLMV